MSDGQAPVTVDDEWPHEPTKPDRAEDLRVDRYAQGYYPTYDELARTLAAVLDDPDEYVLARARELARRATR